MRQKGELIIIANSPIGIMQKLLFNAINLFFLEEKWDSIIEIRDEEEKVTE